MSSAHAGKFAVRKASVKHRLPANSGYFRGKAYFRDQATKQPSRQEIVFTPAA